MVLGLRDHSKSNASIESFAGGMGTRGRSAICASAFMGSFARGSSSVLFVPVPVFGPPLDPQPRRKRTRSDEARKRCDMVNASWGSKRDILVAMLISFDAFSCMAGLSDHPSTVARKKGGPPR